ncbi:hypothetical protein AGOR_G00037440 [Albula goreensis]|uniref:Lysosomal-associated transmembrane protein 5 n=1 Tax=Albula goreensis TaxID=1534307 RepID=A0A8T3E157_9TELE|nr:hypothetical protein AGOR_G00037440 [Albula goreensis]
MHDPNAVHLALFSRSLCCHVRTATVAFTIYYLLSTLVVLADIVMWVFTGKDLGGFIHNEHLTHAQQIFDTASNFLLLIMIGISCIFVLVGLHRGHSYHLVPFIVQLYLDLGLSLMSLFSGPWGLPGTPCFEEWDRLMGYVTQGKELGQKETMMFGVLFVLYLLMKVYAVHTVTKCYYIVKLAGVGKNSQGAKESEKSVSVELPSYDEALKLPSKDDPPAYHIP